MSRISVSPGGPEPLWILARSRPIGPRTLLFLAPPLPLL